MGGDKEVFRKRSKEIGKVATCAYRMRVREDQEYFLAFEKKIANNIVRGKLREI